MEAQVNIRVYATPATIPPGALEGEVAVVIDALRMTSVAATAVQNGCSGILAVGDVETARKIARAETALLGGERNALQIEGFDFSNSPLEYTRVRIGGRKLVMTTSNGTQAILAAQDAAQLLLGAFVNASAVADRVQGAQRVSIICAGTLGAFTLEDALAAGAIIDRIDQRAESVALDDMALAARMLYRQGAGHLKETLAYTAHYGRLQGLGLQADLDYCLGEDRLSAVPERRTDGWFA